MFFQQLFVPYEEFVDDIKHVVVYYGHDRDDPNMGTFVKVSGRSVSHGTWEAEKGIVGLMPKLALTYATFTPMWTCDFVTTGQAVEFAKARIESLL